MRTHHIFWGILFITLGALALINNLTPMNYDWELLYNLWPLVLVMAGLFFILKEFKQRWILMAVTAFVLGVVIFSGFKSLTSFVYNYTDDEYDEETTSGMETFNAPFEGSIKNAELNISSAAGKLKIDEATDSLVSIVSTGSKRNYSFSHHIDNGKANVSFDLGEHNITLKHGLGKHMLDVKLNDKPVWDMRLNAGASAVDLDLSPFKVENLTVKSGAAEVKVKLGSKLDKTNVDFESGVSSIELKIPENSGCRINDDMTLSSKNFPGFNKTDKNTYETANYSSSPNKVEISISAGVSSIKVVRY